MTSYIAGRFEDVTAPDGEVTVRSPADLDDLVGVHRWSLARVDDAVAAARRAAPAWDALGLDARIALVRRLRERLIAHEDTIARTITREMGKVLREARAEAKAMVAKVDIAIDEGLAFTRDWSLDGGKLACRYRPHGVLAVLGPFNFPLHLAHGHVAPALLAGNTVVFKPIEVTPGCGDLYARIVDAVGLPPGVVNVVQGDGRVGAETHEFTAIGPFRAEVPQASLIPADRDDGVPLGRKCGRPDESAESFQVEKRRGPALGTWSQNLPSVFHLPQPHQPIPGVGLHRQQAEAVAGQRDRIHVGLAERQPPQFRTGRDVPQPDLAGNSAGGGDLAVLRHIQ